MRTSPEKTIEMYAQVHWKDEDGNRKGKHLGARDYIAEGEKEAAHLADDGLIEYRNLDPTNHEHRKKFNFPDDAVKRMFKNRPDELKTEALCLAAVQQTGLELKDVPEKLKSAVMCLAAVQQNGRALKYVPDKLKSEVVCLTAVKDDGVALDFVPEGGKSKAVCLAAAQSLLKIVAANALE